MRRARLPTIHAWQSPFGLVEEYEYPAGRADALPTHAHREVQICFSLDFPGRYAYRGRMHDVPVGAISILDSWEPHAASDPCDRDRPSHYVMLYVDPDVFSGAIERPIRTDTPIVHRFRALYGALASGAAPLEQDERYEAFAHEAAYGGATRGRRTGALAPPNAALDRARDYVAAHAADRIRLRELAALAGLSRWHLVRAFRRRFGMTPHQFQLWMRIELARRLLAAGRPSAEVAHRTGFADQSHFARCFKRMMRTTPGRYVSCDSMFAFDAARQKQTRGALFRD